MGKLALAVARLALSAWVGAAVLFVITSVREVRHGGFDSATRDVLAAVRFPPYYAFGFVLVGIGLFGTAIAWQQGAIRRRRALAVLGLVAAALLLMVVDYVWVYSPLRETITPPGQTKPARFASLHAASEWINTVDVTLCLVAAALLNWPTLPATSPDEPRYRNCISE